MGALEVAEGLRVQPPAQLVEAIIRKWGRPRVIVCDRFRLADLQDSARGVPRQLYLPVGVNQFCRFTSSAWTRCWTRCWAALVR